MRHKDIDLFLDSSRLKFLGYSLPEDHETLAGLPLPIHEGVKTLKRVSFFYFISKVSFKILKLNITGIK